MAGDPGYTSRQYPMTNGSNSLSSPYSTGQQQDSYQNDGTRGHVPDTSSLRGRAPTLGSSAAPNAQPQQAGPGVAQGSNAASRMPLERRPSGTAPHYRQASKAHGNNSQSRNAIFVTSPGSSSLNNEVDPMPDPSGMSDLNTMLRRGTSRRRPSASPSNTTGNSVSLSSASTLTPERDATDSSGTLPTLRRLDRSQSSRNRKEHSHHRSRSRNQQQDQKTVGEYALHHLFNKFNSQTDFKIRQCVMDPSLSVERVCGAGADLDFDQLISALAHITHRKPKPLVDTIMLWRMQKREGSQNADEQSSSPQYAPRSRQTSESTSSGAYFDEPAYVTEHRSAVATYLTCRVLIVIFHQAEASAVAPALFEKLEGIVFSQLERMDPLSFDAFPFREANFRIVSQLLGVMSSMNILSIGRCFVGALKNLQKDLNVKGVVPREIEAKAALMIDAMQHLHVRTQPDAAWRDSCDLIHNVGELFINSHGQPIKHAYCDALESLVIPVVANWDPKVGTVKWKDFLMHVNSRLSQMLMKPRHWQEAFRLSIVILCASPTEHFASLWLSTATSLQAKLKDRITRATALEAICRLTWTYLNRLSESSSSSIKKLEDVVKAVLPSGKKSYLTVDSTFSTPIVELIRVIGYGYPEFCFKSILFPLVNADHLLSAKDPKIEQFEPERMTVGIRAFLLIMADLEQGDKGRPPFPRFGSGGLAVDPNTIPELMYTTRNGKASAIARETAADKSSRPVAVSRLSESSKENFARFCEVLGKIITACDSAFGGQAVLDEKFGGLTPKTPLTDAFFGRKEDHSALADHKLGFYELLHVAIQAVPRCIASELPLKRLINLLCTSTAHVQPNISLSATESLKAIARHGHAQAVTTAFANFIFNFDIRYSTMSDEGMLGPGHIENTLRIYVELLQVWIGEIKQKKRDAAAETSGESIRGLQLSLTSLSPYVEEVEAHGVFFLCSQSRIVRSHAVKVLRVVTELDLALEKKTSRIIDILEGDSQRVMDINDDFLNVAERSRLEKGKRRSMGQHTLIEICSSDVSYDATLWLKLFPNIIRLSLDESPLAVEIGREIVCNRLVQMHDSISRLDSESNRPLPTPGGDPNSFRSQNRIGSTPPEIVIEQWKLYLIMACTTMKEAGAQTQSQLDNTQHARKASKGAQQSQDRINSARALLAFVIPLLSASQSSIREAIVTALGSIHIKLYRTLLDSLQYAITTCKEEARQRIGPGPHQRTGSNPQKDRRTERLRTEVAQVYRLTARFLHEESVLRDDWILNNLCTYTKDLMMFLADNEIQNDWEYQKLRRQSCGLLEEVFNGINRTADPSRYMSFELRKSSFILIEEWSGFSTNQSRAHQREDYMRQAAAERLRDPTERSNAMARMEIEKRELSNAALSAMASLCAGPIVVKTNTGATLAFDSRRMLSWITHVFQDPSDKLHTIGRRALMNLITYNRDAPFLMEHAVEQCYFADRPRVLESYFDVVSKVLSDYSDYPLPFWRVLGAMLFTLGDENGDIRTKSAKLLQRLEQRQQKNSGIQDFDISISDKTKAVFKQAQFDMSQKLADKYTDLAFFIFSQFALHFRTLNNKPDSQRNMVATILPWIRVIELQVEAKGGPTSQSYMVLANLLEITIRASSVLHNEIQALWQALAARHAGNVQLVLDFVISLCLDRRDQSLVSYTKQIVVHLSKTQAGQKVVEFLLLQVTPKNMVQKPREPIIIPPDNLSLPYVADMSEALPIVREQHGFSLGHLSLIFLVDLMVGKIKLIPDTGDGSSRQDYDADSVNLKPASVALLLQEIFVLWDSSVPIVQDQAREMLVHLIHGLVIMGTEDGSTDPTKSAIQEFVELVRKKDPETVWQYRERDGRGEILNFNDQDDELRVPASMPIIAGEVVGLFKLKYPRIQEDMARVALQWGTSCPVRHIACRSLQIFRCILVPLDRPMLIDVLARISNTVVHEEEDVQLFAIEMLTTMKTIIGALEPAELLQWPHLFWTACACLDTIYEREFVATLSMIEKLLSQINLSDPAVVKLLEKARPSRWHGNFEGIAPAVYKGFKSEMALEKSLRVLDLLVGLPESSLVGDQSRLLFAILANLPGFLNTFEEQSRVVQCQQSASNLAAVADSQDQHQVAMILNTYAQGRYSSGSEFLSQMLSTLRRAFFPTWELRSLIFVIGLLTNRSHWYKIKTLEVLKVLILDVDTRRPDIANQGPDLISPLLRLLQTQYCPQAIEVLDHIMYMAETPMSRHHMRMSMAGLGSRSLPVRKEYEKTQSLYGIPEETGWSVPMPAIYSNTTRTNMQVIHHDCAHPSATEAEAAPTPEIEFHPDEDQPGSYFSLERSETMQTEETLHESNVVEGGMGDVLSKLNSLNDFFDDDFDGSEDPSNRYSSVTITPFNQDIDNGAEFYDQETAPILQQTLTRNPSVSSFHNGYAERRDPSVMTPTAFNPPSSNLGIAQRPPLHSRSVTSPANNLNRPTRNAPEMLSEDEAEETFSEDERVTGHVAGNPRLVGSHSLRGTQNGLRKAPPGMEGREYRQRGLLRGHSQSRTHGHSPSSPQVPKVPDAYLRMNDRSEPS